MEHGFFKDALKKIKPIQDVENESIQKLYGEICLSNGNFNKAIKINPKDYQSFYNLANCYKDEKNYEEALKAYNTALDAPSDLSEIPEAEIVFNIADTAITIGTCFLIIHIIQHRHIEE